jgi:hypothetical protein
VHEATTDVRVGGRYAVSFSTEDGEEHNVSGVYREVGQTGSSSSPGRGAPCPPSASRWSRS